jgi:hypothetical protein
MIKPTKVLCKRTLTSGDTYWWDDEATPPIRHEHDNRMFVAGNWYDVVHSDNDSWDEEKREFTFTVIDNQNNPHLHFMYEQQDMEKWPDICTKYGPRDYAKWFYTPEELIQLENGTFKLVEDINIKPGNNHWVKTKEGKWIIAQCSSRMVYNVTDKFYWKIIGTDLDKTCFDFAEIGEQVVSRKEQFKEKEMSEVREELLSELFALTDSINEPYENHPSVEYVMPFVNKAIDKYFDASLKNYDFLKE